MSAKKSNRRGYKSASNKHNGIEWGAVLKVTVGMLILGALGVGVFLVKNKQDSINSITFCNKAGPSEVHMVLLDASDKMDGVQAERVKASILQSAKHSTPGSRIDIYIADTLDGSLTEPLFSKCNPGEPDKYAAIYSDAKSHKETFEKEFLEAIEEMLSAQVNADAASTSPIIESIRSAAAKSMSRLDESTPIRVTIVSDMVQNSPLFRQKTGKESFGDFKASPSWPSAISDLHGASVNILYLARSQYRSIQGRSHQVWWESYIGAINGHLKSVDTI